MTNTSTARVACERPGRYAKQLANHFGRKIETRWDSEERRGYLNFSGDEVSTRGGVEMIAGDGVLLLQVETDAESLDTLEEVVGRHLVRFGEKDGLVVEWKRPGGVDGTRQSQDL